MDEKRLYDLICAHLDIKPEQVMAWRVYDDYLRVVVNRGGAGCPKYRIELADLEPPAEEAPVEPPKAPRKPRKRRASK